ncbi:MAG: hypothetical protein ACJAYX_004907 [Planctomycetota bacterium]|jgi:hypothetical protein
MYLGVGSLVRWRVREDCLWGGLHRRIASTGIESLGKTRVGS